MSRAIEVSASNGPIDAPAPEGVDVLLEQEILGRLLDSPEVLPAVLGIAVAAMALTAETMAVDRPMRPHQVAERWGCSEQHVRNLIKRGELGHFRLGGRLLRIPASAVEEYEQRQITGVSLAITPPPKSPPKQKKVSGADLAFLRAAARNPMGR